MSTPAPLDQPARATETAALTPRDAVGRLWRVVVIQEGVSKNNWNYPAHVLERDARVFEGVKVAVSWEALDHHDPVGVLRNVAAERVDGLMAITADAEIDDPEAQRRLLEAYRAKKPYEFSIDANVRASEGKDSRGRVYREVSAILEPTELTIVRRGAAGGRVQRLVASEQTCAAAEAVAAIAAAAGYSTAAGLAGAAFGVTRSGDSSNVNANSAGSTGAESTSDHEEGTTMAAPATADKESKLEGGAPARAAESDANEKRVKEALEGAARAQKQAEEAAAKALEQAAQAERRARESEFRMLLNEKLADSKLPKDAIARVREAFLGEDGKSVRVVEAADLDKAIKREREYVARIAEAAGAGSGKISGCGGSDPSDSMIDQVDRLQAAMDGFFSGNDEPVRSKQSFARLSGKQYVRVAESASGDRVPRFRSLHEAAEQIHNGGRRMNAEEVFHACMGGKTSSMRATERFRARESISTSTLANVLVEAVHRRLLKEYMLDSHVAMVRRIASQITPVKDFRANQRMRYGGYGLLSTVAEGSTYPTLTSPGDYKQSFTISKKGGVEDITMEMIANDDVGAIQRIPTKLKQAAAETLFQAIFDNFANNSNIGDGSAIFRSGNKTSSPFSKATMNAARKAMAQQSPPNDTSKKIGAANLPKIWIGPRDLEEAAVIQFKSASKVVAPETTTQVENTSAGVPNIHGGVEVMVVDYWTDTADCLVMADPALMDTLEIGFFNGQEEPELFVQDMVNVGSGFDADKIKFKIRHIWGYLFPDYRPFYGFSRA